MDSKHPPAQQLLPRLSPLLAPASHATWGRAGRCAAPWRPAPRMPRRPAPYLAAGGRSRKERGASRWWRRGPFPLAQTASHAQPQRRRPVPCCFPATVPQCRCPRCPAPSNLLYTVLWILCRPFVPFADARANTIVGTPGKVSGICNAQ